MAVAFSVKARYAHKIRWSKEGTCGESGCAEHPGCGCALCGKPIGVSEFDPRWDEHDQDCQDCELCRDSVPWMLFRGEGKNTERASFHQACFEKVIHFREGCATGGAAGV